MRIKKIFEKYNLEMSSWDASFCLDLDDRAIELYCEAKKSGKHKEEAQQLLKEKLGVDPSSRADH